MNPQGSSNSKPVLNIWFVVFLILCFVSLCLPFVGAASFLNSLGLFSTDLWYWLVMVVLPSLLMLIALAFGVMAGGVSRYDKIWRTSRLSGILLAVMLVLTFAPSPLSYLGGPGIVAICLTLICAVSTFWGFYLSRKPNAKNATSKGKKSYKLTLIVLIVAFVFVCLPLTLNAIRNFEATQSLKEIDASQPQTADEWVSQNATDYAVVKKSIDDCKVVDVFERTRKTKGTTTQYLGVRTNIYESDLARRAGNATEYVLPLSESDRLRKDVATVKERCGWNVSWQAM
jgi:hypothetical protein